MIGRVYIMCYDVHNPTPPQHAPLVEAHHRYILHNIIIVYLLIME